MGRQLSTVVHRLGLVRTRERPRPIRESPLGGAGPELADVRLATAARVRTGLTVGDRDRYDTLLGQAAAEGPDCHEVLRRVLATARSVDAVAEFADAWGGLSPSSRAAVADPVRGFSSAGRQADSTTCGSAVLTMLAAAGDPALALWFATGEVLRRSRPPELAAAPAERLRALAAGPPQGRFVPVHQVVKRWTSTRSGLGLPWLAAFGTPPWGAARLARFVGVEFDHVPLDDTDRPHLERVLDRVATALGRGVPVPLYTGGDTTRGWSAALPRHVVLTVGQKGSTVELWEPAAGRVEAISRADLLAGGRAQRALGGWSHLAWAVLPDLGGGGLPGG